MVGGKMMGWGKRSTNADDTSWLFWRVVEDALANVVVEMGAVVVCLHGVTLGLVSVGMEGIQVSTDPVNGREILCRVSICGRARELKTSPAQLRLRSQVSCWSRSLTRRQSCC